MKDNKIKMHCPYCGKGWMISKFLTNTKVLCTKCDHRTKLISNESWKIKREKNRSLRGSTTNIKTIVTERYFSTNIPIKELRKKIKNNIEQPTEDWPSWASHFCSRCGNYSVPDVIVEGGEDNFAPKQKKSNIYFVQFVKERIL